MRLTDRSAGVIDLQPRTLRRSVFMLRNVKWRYPHPPEPKEENKWPGENLPKAT